MHINSSISNNSVQHKYSFFVYTKLNIKIILFQTIQFSISILFQCQKTVPFQTIQFCISTQFSSIWSINGILSGATIPAQSWRGSDGNEGVLRVLHCSRITGTSPSDCLVSYPGQSFEESYLSEKMQSVYSTTLADGTTLQKSSNSSRGITFTFIQIPMRKKGMNFRNPPAVC